MSLFVISACGKYPFAQFFTSFLTAYFWAVFILGKGALFVTPALPGQQAFLRITEAGCTGLHLIGNSVIKQLLGADCQALT